MPRTPNHAGHALYRRKACAGPSSPTNDAERARNDEQEQRQRHRRPAPRVEEQRAADQQHQDQFGQPLQVFLEDQRACADHGRRCVIGVRVTAAASGRQGQRRLPGCCAALACFISVWRRATAAKNTARNPQASDRDRQAVDHADQAQAEKVVHQVVLVRRAAQAASPGAPAPRRQPRRWQCRPAWPTPRPPAPSAGPSRPGRAGPAGPGRASRTGRRCRRSGRPRRSA